VSKPGLHCNTVTALGAIVIPVRGPLHQVVSGNHGRSPVEDLSTEAAECVEDGVVCSASEGVLTVRRDTVRDDALLLLDRGTWKV
jgi:hypothetical protein